VRGEINGDTGAGGHADGVSVGREGTGVVDCEIRSAVCLHLFFGGTDEHVAHEETVVGSGTDDTDLDSVARVPPGVTVKDVNS